MGVITIIEDDPNGPPLATDDTIYLTNMGTVDIAAADGVLANDLPDPLSLTALLDTLPVVGTLDPNPDPSGLNPDGSFTYTYNDNDNKVGAITTFQYHNNDGSENSNVATALIRRQMTVTSASADCAAGTTCDWFIGGRIAAEIPDGTVIEALLNGVTPIGTVVETGGTGWWMSINDIAVVPGPTDTVTVRAVGYPNALITDYPVAAPLVATDDAIYLTNMGSVDIAAADGVLTNDLPDPLSLTALLDTLPGLGTLDSESGSFRVESGWIVYLYLQ